MIIFPIILALIGLYMLIAWIITTLQKGERRDRRRGRHERRRRFARA